MRLARILRAAATVVLLANPRIAAAQTPVTVAGKVLAATGEPVSGARVTILELKRRATTDADGAFRFELVPPGRYLLEAVSPRFGSTVQRVDTASSPTDVTLQLDIGIHQERVTVTGTTAKTSGELAQPVDILEGRDLEQQLQSSLGETLAQQPGVVSTFFGTGASRPVIRGLGGERIKMMVSGVDVGDVSDLSPDHAVTVNTLTTEKIDVVRGPATLMYGSSAIGGVVNTIDGRIPTYLPDSVITGTADIGIGSVSNEKRGALSLGGRVGNLAWHGDGSRLTAGNYDIPGFGRIPVEPGEPRGFVPNSANEADGWSGGLSYIGGIGYIGASYSGWNSFYGSPAEEEVKLDMKQRRVDVQGEITIPFAFLRGAKVRFGRNDYHHVELEGGEVGTLFEDNVTEGRLELSHRPLGPLSGAFGVQLSRRNLSATGEEALLPKTKTDNQAFFLFEELPVGAVTLQLGGRYEHQSNDAEEREIGHRTFNAYSGSIGAVWSSGTDWSVGLSLARTSRAPSAQDLFADGPHPATGTFEIGDPLLKNETATGLDFAVKRLTGPVSGSLSFFYNHFDGFIYERFTGELEDDLQVIVYTQQNARFLGGEGHIDVELLHREPHHVALELGADYVRAEATVNDQPLPRIPPLRFSAGFRYSSTHWFGLVEVRHANAQNRVAPEETTTPGYTLLNAAIGYRLFTGPVISDLLLRGRNLTNEEARNHVSFLKNIAPFPGRDVSFGIRTAF
ncbi:MAG TPA: TonB-dependent receptor [Thermoanaerobaculia bacterium]